VSFLLQTLNAKTIEREAAEKLENPSLLKVILPAWAAAGTATLTNLGLKAFSELLKVSLKASIVCFVAVVVPCAAVQIQSINRGLRLYPQTIFFPIYSSLLVLSNSLFGSLIFLESVAMKPHEIGVFGLGVALVMAGISLYSQRKSDDTKENDASDENGSLNNHKSCRSLQSALLGKESRGAELPFSTSGAGWEGA